MASNGPLTFLYQGLYEAVDNYREEFCQGLSPDQFLFATGSGKELRANVTMPKLIPFLPLTADEEKHLNVETWRKLWANWNESHNDAAVRKSGLKAMKHSEATRDKFYSVQEKLAPLHFGNTILNDILRKKNPPLTVDEPEEDEEPGPKEDDEPEEDEEPGPKEDEVPEENSNKKRKTDQYHHLSKKKKKVVQPKEKRKTFTQTERNLIRNIFALKEGQPRTTLSLKEVEAMKKSNKDFKKIWDETFKEKQHSTAKGKTSTKVFAAIRKCILG